MTYVKLFLCIDKAHIIVLFSDLVNSQTKLQMEKSRLRNVRVQICPW